MKNAIVAGLILIVNVLTAQVNCSLTYERTLAGFDVYIHNPSGATMYRAKMYIDADGSPRAYGPNNSGLDYTANAGYTGNWWGVVADASGQNPILQTASDPFPGMYVSTTSLVNSNYGISNPLRYVNSETVPFIAMPTNVLSDGGIHVGDVAYVYNTTTGQSCFAIYADAGNTTSIGEGSIYLASQIGVDPDVRTGGTSLGIIDYVVFPNSGFGQGYIPTIAEIDSIGNQYLATVGGPCICTCIGAVFDNTAPTTTVNIPAGWDTTNFTASFADADNSCSGLLSHLFYQVQEFSGSDWRANASRGFYNENFIGTTLNADWTAPTGTWSLGASGLHQSNENLSNTNCYASVTQNLSDAYLYCWTGSMDGVGSNRRAGFHFNADQPDSSNRGNSYFVWFRLDDDKIQIYKSINNSWGSGPVKDTAYNFTANQVYDFKVLYDHMSGLIRVYVNDQPAAQWIDASPFVNGSFVSFRSADCNYTVDNFKVYRSRSSMETILVGASASNDIRNCNADPITPAGLISTYVVDASRNISTSAFSLVYADFTAPVFTGTVNDGSASDIDSTMTQGQLDVNWTAAVDTNSDIATYYFTIGTSPGDTDVVAWTNNGNNTSASVTGLTLVDQQIYYTSVFAVNGAGLRSAVITSDGQRFSDISLYMDTKSEDANFIVFPNPTTTGFSVTITTPTTQPIQLSVYDENGKKVAGKLVSATGETTVHFENSLAPGTYLVEMLDEKGQRTTSRLVIQR